MLWSINAHIVKGIHSDGQVFVNLNIVLIAERNYLMEDIRMILYEATIPLNPKTKKNNQRIIINRNTRKPMVVQSEAYKQYEKDAGWFLKRPSSPISVPVNVKCIFYRDSERRCDLTNLLEAIDDILVHWRILADDNFKIIVSHDGSRVFVDRQNPRTEIFIEDISEI